MKLLILVAAIGAGLTVSSAHAGITVTPLGGYHYPEGGSVVIDANQDLAKSEGHVYGGAVGYEFANGKTQVQLEYLKTEAKDKVHAGGVFTGDKVKNTDEQYSVNVLHELGDQSGRASPYLLIGAGHNKSVSHVDPENPTKSDDTIANVGVGTRYYVNQHVALRGELRGVHHFEESKWDGKALVGAELKFGGSLSGVAPALDPVMQEPIITTWELPTRVSEPLPVLPIEDEPEIDQDGDGVPDHLDACPRTPSNLVVDDRGCPQTVKVADELKVELRVFFDYDKADIKPQFVGEVAKVAEQMAAFPNAVARIEGHASKDSDKSKSEYNQRLSQARAEAVKNLLITQFGVPAAKLSAMGFGFDKPIAPNTTEEGRAMNRRVYAIIQGERVETVERTKDMQ